MPSLRSRNQLVLAKVESVEGEDANPNANDNAILVELPQIRLNPQNTETNEVGGSLDPNAPIVGGLQVSVTIPVNAKGADAVATAPEYGPLLQGCGWAETITSTAIPVAAEAAAAGSANTLTLGAGAAGTAQLYRGMPLLLTVNPAAGTTFITDYTAGKVATLTDAFSPVLDNTTEYQIPVNVLYSPASVSIPSLTIYLYQDGVLWKLVGCRGTFTFEAPTARPARFNFTFSGTVLSKEDAAVPGGVFDDVRPPVFKAASMLVDRATSSVGTFRVDNGNRLTFPGNPNAPEGFDPVEITERRMTGSVDPSATLVATRDIFGSMQVGDQKIIHGRWGTVAANRIGVTIPTALFLSDDPGDREGILTEEVNFQAPGIDAGAFFCFY